MQVTNLENLICLLRIFPLPLKSLLNIATAFETIDIILRPDLSPTWIERVSRKHSVQKQVRASEEMGSWVKALAL